MNSAQDITLKCNAKKIKFIQNAFSKVDNCSLMMLLALIGITEGCYINIDTDDGSGEEHTFSIRTIYTKYSVEMDSNIGLITILENLNDNYDHVVNKLAFATTETENKKYSDLYNVEIFMGYLLGGVEILYKSMTLIGDDEERIFDGILEKITFDSDLLYDLSQNLIKEEEELYGKTFT